MFKIYCMLVMHQKLYTLIFVSVLLEIHMSCSDCKQNLPSAAVLQAAPILVLTGKRVPWQSGYQASH